jgi:hypothetical protein
VPALPNLRLISHKSSICFFERFAWQAVFSRPFFQKNYPHSLAKCLSCRCRQQREKYAVLRQEQSVSCQSKILPQYQNSLFAHFAPAGILLGSAFPKPCHAAYAAYPAAAMRQSKGGFTMRKRYNTPHRSRVVKTRMTEEEYAEFAERLSAYNMSQAEFIRQPYAPS